MDRHIPKNELKELIGTEVWFRDSWSPVNSGILEYVSKDPDDVWARIKIPGAGTTDCILVEDIYHTKEDLMEANADRSQAEVDEYCSKIRTVGDLVKFCCDNMVCRYSLDDIDLTDWEARKAARIMAKKLLDVEIDPEQAALEETGA